MKNAVVVTGEANFDESDGSFRASEQNLADLTTVLDQLEDFA